MGLQEKVPGIKVESERTPSIHPNLEDREGTVQQEPSVTVLEQSKLARFNESKPHQIASKESPSVVCIQKVEKIVSYSNSVLHIHCPALAALFM